MATGLIHTTFTALAVAAAVAGAAAAQPMMQGRGPMMPPGMTQPGQGYGPGYGPGMMGHGMRGHGMMMGMMGGGYTEGGIAFLKAELGITAQQEAAWTPFAEALRAFGATMHGPRYGRSQPPASPPPASPPQASQSLPDSLDTRVGWMEGHLAAMKTLRDAARPLYAALTAEQKAKADDLLGSCPACQP